jgi:hypothetical protein
VCNILIKVLQNNQQTRRGPWVWRRHGRCAHCLMHGWGGESGMRDRGTKLGVRPQPPLPLPPALRASKIPPPPPLLQSFLVSLPSLPPRHPFRGGGGGGFNPWVRTAVLNKHSIRATAAAVDAPRGLRRTVSVKKVRFSLEPLLRLGWGFSSWRPPRTAEC